MLPSTLLLFLCLAVFGDSFHLNAALSAPGCALGRHDAKRCHVAFERRGYPQSVSRASAGSQRDFAISPKMGVRAGDGGGDDTLGEKAAIEATEGKIDAVEEEIRTLSQKIDAVETALCGGAPYLGMTDRDQILDEKKQLVKEKEQLRDEKKQLRKKEEQLREEVSRARASITPANKNVTDFAAALTRAAVTDNTLELASDTCFLGDSTLGSKLFIRPCYRQLSEIILNDASSGRLRNFVVTGTPGIGKSVLGFYLLYLLRCEGKTVMFERKDFWYRFSDEGAKRESLDTFKDAGYFEDDPTAWYLSDPKYQPGEVFAGITVVLVSPKAVRVTEFMKKPKSQKLFMPVWSENELLECRRIVYPHMASAAVEGAFYDVGGVARAVFDVLKLKLHKAKMETYARELDVGLLRAALSPQMARATDDVGDTLFHIFPDVEYTGYDVRFASNDALELVVEAISVKESDALRALVAAAIYNPELGSMVGGTVVGSWYEKFVHKKLTAKANQSFGMRMLTRGKSKDMSEVHDLSLNFTRSEVFYGNKLPGAFDIGTYYEPSSQNFPAIDSFGVDRSSGTLYFFQMKSTGVEKVKGQIVEEHYNKALARCKSIKSCVFVFVVPKGEYWEKANKIKEGGDWLEGATPDFEGQVPVCVIEV